MNYQKLQKELLDIPVEEKQQQLRIKGIAGLVLKITPANNRIFYLYYKDNEGTHRKYRIDVFDETGIKGINLRQAADKLIQLKANILNNNDPRQTRINKRKQANSEEILLLRNYLDNAYYPKWADSNHKSPKRTKQILEFNFHIFMKKRIDEINTYDLDKWRTSKQDGTFKGPVIEATLQHSKTQPRTQKPSSNATINRAEGVLRAALNKAVEWDIIEATKIKKRKSLPTAKTAGKFMIDDEIDRLYGAMENWSGYFPVLIKLLLNTGLRPKEAYTLEWSNIDLNDKRTITVVAEHAKNGYMRTVGINNTLHTILSNWRLENTNPKFVFPGASPNKHIVRVQKSWDKLTKQTNMQQYRLYDCRHSFASKMANNPKIPLKVVSRILGHSSISMTEIYVHADKETELNAMYELD